jgi:hypothetical protein
MTRDLMSATDNEYLSLQSCMAALPGTVLLFPACYLSGRLRYAVQHDDEPGLAEQSADPATALLTAGSGAGC